MHCIILKIKEENNSVNALTQEMHFSRTVIEITQHRVEFLSAAWAGFSIFTHDRRISLTSALARIGYLAYGMK